MGRPLGDTPSPVSTHTKVLLLAFSQDFTRILGKMSLGRKKIPLLKEKKKKTV